MDTYPITTSDTPPMEKRALTEEQGLPWWLRDILGETTITGGDGGWCIDTGFGGASFNWCDGSPSPPASAGAPSLLSNPILWILAIFAIFAFFFVLMR